MHCHYPTAPNHPAICLLKGSPERVRLSRRSPKLSLHLRSRDIAMVPCNVAPAPNRQIDVGLWNTTSLAHHAYLHD